MSDLISRSDVINLLCNLHIDNIAVNDKKVTQYIRELPTAYDVEKVVGELDEYLIKLVGRGSALYQTVMHIVKKGGV